METNPNPSMIPSEPQPAQPQDPAPGSGPPRGSRTWIFLRHYAEMVVAMLLGMFVLGGLLAALLELAGVDVGRWDEDEPELFLLGMAFTMTVPMVAWMRHRGHGWRASGEMTAAMFVPALLAIGLLWTEVSTNVHGLMGIEHTVMFTAMFGVMLLRLDEYTGAH